MSFNSKLESNDEEIEGGSPGQGLSSSRLAPDPNSQKLVEMVKVVGKLVELFSFGSSKRQEGRRARVF